MMATGMMMTGMAFVAGLGLGAAAVGGACLARKAMKRRSEWRDDHHHPMPSDTTGAAMHGDDPTQPGAMPAG
jgi:hypothetical protein